MALTVAAIADFAKDAGVAITAASGLAYACGYLSMRARAHALGTDPGFALIDQEYIFAGMRFALSQLFALLLVGLLVVAPVQWLHEWATRLLNAAGGALALVVALVLGFATITMFRATLDIENLLLAGARTPLARSALNSGGPGGVYAILGGTALAVLALLLATARFSAAPWPDAIGTLLLVEALLLGLLLPITHGVFHADRSARRLARAPEGAGDLAGTVWLVDRGAGDRAVLFGYDIAGMPRLITIKAETMDGIAVVGVDDLGALELRRPLGEGSSPAPKSPS